MGVSLPLCCFSGCSTLLSGWMGRQPPYGVRVAPCCPRVAPVSPAPLIPPGRRHGLHAYTLERSGVSPATDYFLSSFLPKAKRHAGRDGLP